MSFISLAEKRLYLISQFLRGDCIRDLVVSQQLLGTREIAVFHHTDCGMLTFKNDEFKQQLKEKYPDQASLIDSTSWGAMDDVDQTVKDDVKLLREHPLLLKEATITGWVYETETGKVDIIHTHYFCCIDTYPSRIG